MEGTREEAEGLVRKCLLQDVGGGWVPSPRPRPGIFEDQNQGRYEDGGKSYNAAGTVWWTLSKDAESRSMVLVTKAFIFGCPLALG